MQDLNDPDQIKEEQADNDIQSNISQRPMSKESRQSYGSCTPHNRLKVYCSLKKKQSECMNYVSQSPSNYSPKCKQPFQKRVSLSPQRKNMYWQNWLLTTHNSLSASEVQLPPNISAQSYCLMMGDTGQILLSNNQDQRREIASLTKIMTAYTVICICNSNGIKIRDHTITIHQQASGFEGTSANLRMGDQLTVYDLLFGLMLPSGNDAAIALAQHFGKYLSFKFVKCDGKETGSSAVKFQDFKQYYDRQYKTDSIKLFVFEMNKNCYKIGLKNTYFANPSGLNNTKSYSTARDMALLSAHCLKNHSLHQIFKRKSYSCEVWNERLGTGKQMEWKNTNKHLFRFRECIGIKTGITPNAGPCLSSAYRVMGHQVIAIVLNCASADERYSDAEKLYRYCRKKIRVY